MFVPMADEVAREMRKDALRRAELHRLVKLAEAGRLSKRVLVAESIRRGLMRIGQSIEADVTEPVTE